EAADMAAATARRLSEGCTQLIFSPLPTSTDPVRTSLRLRGRAKRAGPGLAVDLRSGSANYGWRWAGPSMPRPASPREAVAPAPCPRLAIFGRGLVDVCVKFSGGARQPGAGGVVVDVAGDG